MSSNCLKVQVNNFQKVVFVITLSSKYLNENSNDSSTAVCIENSVKFFDNSDNKRDFLNINLRAIILDGSKLDIFREALRG